MKNLKIFSIGFTILIIIMLNGCDNSEIIKLDVAELETAEHEIQEAQNSADQKIQVEKIQIKNTEIGIPINCVSWFDGCNNCSVSNGIIGACTRKYCTTDQLKSPRCLKME